jgi:ABC-2 type transport system ATP-binding protein
MFAMRKIINKNYEEIEMIQNGIKVQNLVKKFGDITAVNDLSFDVKSGEIFGLLGPNGAGKTTIINIMTGLLEPTSRTALVGGFDIKKQIKEIRKLIGVCPQEPAF